MCIALPFIGAFSKFIIMIIPERGPSLTRNIDFSVASIPAVAIETARRTAQTITIALVEAVTSEIREGFTQKTGQKLSSIDEALSQTRLFLSGIRSSQGSTSNERARHVSVLHVVDHLENLSQYCRETDNARTLLDDEAQHFLALELCERFKTITERLIDTGTSDQLHFAEETSVMMTDVRKKEREMILHQTAMGQISPDDAYKKIEALRWLDRIAYRVWRAAYHLSEYA
jgi:phosphate:Na+ symporter